jgi:hypothetical protein
MNEPHQHDAAQHHTHLHKADQHLQGTSRDNNSSQPHCVRSNSSSSSSSEAGMMWEVPAEEEAFLRSLGWTSVESDDEGEWGLTDEEIAAFQAAAATRAAAQQLTQHPQQQQQQQADVCGGGYQQKLLANGLQGGLGFTAKALEGPEGALWRVAAANGYVGGGCVVQGRAAAAAAATGALLGVHLAPELLGYDSCDDSSSSDEEDADGSASRRHGMVY